MIENKEKEIDGVLYMYTPLMATPARDQLDQLIHKFGPAIASGIEGLQTVQDFDLESNVVSEMLPAVSGSIGAAVRGFSEGLNTGFHKNLVDTFMKQVHFQNTEGNMQHLTKDVREIMFATNLLTETKVLGWCLEVQYSDFFGLLRRAGASTLSSLATKKASVSSSPKDSTGASSGLPQVKSTPAP